MTLCLKMKFKRVYRPITEWEEIRFGMWSDVKNKKDMIRKAILFTGNHRLYGKYMMRVVNEWPASCENALTDYNLNRRAWVGHAASALAINCPEDITREAWRFLTDEQQKLANRQADRAIQHWEKSYRKNKGIRESVGKPML